MAPIFNSAGGTQRLPRLVGQSIAKDIIFTGRRIGGRDAMSMGMQTNKLLFPLPVFYSYPTPVVNNVCDISGLVNYCVPAGEAHPKALEIAREINQKVIFMHLQNCLCLEAHVMIECSKQHILSRVR